MRQRDDVHGAIDGDLLADRDAWSLDDCSVANALDVVGNRTSLLLLREAFLGTTRFDDFAARVGASDTVVANRLRALAEARILTRVPYRESGQRTRMEYRLTDKGRDIHPVIIALRDWGDRWQSGPDGPSVHGVHRGCGAAVRAEVRCASGHPVAAGHAALLPGAAAVNAS